jgi:hypothetical protein
MTDETVGTKSDDAGPQRLPDVTGTIAVTVETIAVTAETTAETTVETSGSHHLSKKENRPVVAVAVAGKSSQSDQKPLRRFGENEKNVKK